MRPPILIQMISFFIISTIMKIGNGLKSDLGNTAVIINHFLK